MRVCSVVDLCPTSAARDASQALQWDTPVNPVDAAPAKPPHRIVWLSRRTSTERHVVGEERILGALRAAFGQSAIEVFGPEEGQLYDPLRTRSIFSSARALIGPHGAAFVNVIYTDSAPMVLLPLCDAVGCPAAQDFYFSYIAGALGVKLVIPPQGPRCPSWYRNYTVDEGTSQIEALVNVVRGLVDGAK